MNEYNSQIQLIRNKEMSRTRQMKQNSYDDFNSRRELFSSSFKSGRKDKIHEI